MMVNREPSGFRKQNLNVKDRSKELEEESRKIAKTKSNFIVYYLIAHIFVVPFPAFMAYGLTTGGSWDMAMFILALGLAGIVIFEIILWTRSGTGEYAETEAIQSRYPWIGAILLACVITFTLMIRSID